MMSVEGKAALITSQKGTKVTLEFELGTDEEASMFYEHICYQLDQGTFSFEMFNLGGPNGKN